MSQVRLGIKLRWINRMVAKILLCKMSQCRLIYFNVLFANWQQLI